MGSFLFKWPHPEANDVHVTGTFDDWGKSVQLNKVGDIWEKDVELAKADEKILYKFVVNDQWIIDPEAPQEDDGQGNVNNVLHPHQIRSLGSVVPEALTTSSAAPGSTTAALAGGVPLEPKRDATEVTPFSDSHLNGPKNTAPGAFPETPANEPDSFSVNPLPPSESATNPVTLPAGEAVPPLGDVTTNTVHSGVTTSKDDYEKAGSSVPFIGGALAALGLGGIGGMMAKKENVIPESSLPMGENADKSLNASPFVSSSGPNTTTADLAGKVPLESTTSAVPEQVKESIKEAHVDPEATASSEAVKEKAAVEAELLKKVPTTTETGESALFVAAASAATSTAPTSAVPEPVKESIAEAHAEPEATTSSEAVAEKAAVEQELLKKVPEQTEAGEPAPTIAAASSTTAPAATTETAIGAAPGQSSTAAATVADGADAGGEKIEAPKTTVVPEKTEGDNTEYAPPHTSSTAPGVSGSAAAAVSDGAEDPTLLDEPAVQLGIKHDAEAAGGSTAAATTTADAPKGTAHDATTIAPESKKEEPTPTATEPTAIEPTATEPTATAPTTATETPKKATATTPATTPASATPASAASASKDKKKKHRVSSFFKKIFD